MRWAFERRALLYIACIPYIFCFVSSSFYTCITSLHVMPFNICIFFTLLISTWRNLEQRLLLKLENGVLKTNRIILFLVWVIQISTPFLQNILYLPYKLGSNGLLISFFDRFTDHFYIYFFSLRCCDTEKLFDKQWIPKSFFWNTNICVYHGLLRSSVSNNK